MNRKISVGRIIRRTGGDQSTIDQAKRTGVTASFSFLFPRGDGVFDLGSFVGHHVVVWNVHPDMTVLRDVQSTRIRSIVAVCGYQFPMVERRLETIVSPLPDEFAIVTNRPALAVVEREARPDGTPSPTSKRDTEIGYTN